MQSLPQKPIKPLLRGHIHQEAFFVALGACMLLFVKCSTPTERLACGIYSLSLLLLFGASTLYHRPHWEPRARALMKRVDHSAIFILIAGTFTPVCLLAIAGPQGEGIAAWVWLGALAGVLQAIFWVRAPKWLAAFLYVGMGWLFLSSARASTLSPGDLGLLVSGGVIYSLGALVYALKRPRIVPSVFGYHELFHLLTVVAAGLHFVMIYHLVGLAHLIAITSRGHKP